MIITELIRTLRILQKIPLQIRRLLGVQRSLIRRLLLLFHVQLFILLLFFFLLYLIF